MSGIKISEKELSTAYSPNQIEDKWYPIWGKSNAFKPAKNNAESFTLMIPPPNVGHVGALSLSLHQGIWQYLFALVLPILLPRP